MSQATAPLRYTDRFYIGGGIGRGLGREGMHDFTETHVMAVPR